MIDAHVSEDMMTIYAVHDICKGVVKFAEAWEGVTAHAIVAIEAQTHIAIVTVKSVSKIGPIQV